MFTTWLLAIGFSSLSAGHSTTTAPPPTTYPTTVEVDLVFPRNETYAPLSDFPVIFAIQNAKPATLLRFSIGWGIADAVNPFDEYHLTWLATGYYEHAAYSDNGSEGNFTTDTDFITWNAGGIDMGNDTERKLRILFNAQGWYCSKDSSGNMTQTDKFSHYPSSIYFTLKNNASRPVLVTVPDDCPTVVDAYNFTGQLANVNIPADSDPFCLTLGDSPKSNPCAVTIDALIAAELTTKVACGKRGGYDPIDNGCHADNTSLATRLTHGSTSLTGMGAMLGLSLVFLGLY